MFGKTIVKHCNNCDKKVTFNVSTGVIVNLETYHPLLLCYDCNDDLSKDDTLIVEKVRLEGKIDGVIMY